MAECAVGVCHAMARAARVTAGHGRARVGAVLTAACALGVSGAVLDNSAIFFGGAEPGSKLAFRFIAGESDMAR